MIFVADVTGAIGLCCCCWGEFGDRTSPDVLRALGTEGICDGGGGGCMLLAGAAATGLGAGGAPFPGPGMTCCSALWPCCC